ncbi:MAG TPA: type II toxin-antitoxin system YafQ family toxin [Solidesulfovibrio magneticus]|nr:type II toxin-antitoxin system YafQ family toxin [Solidesulfovibrio magneticus]
MARRGRDMDRLDTILAALAAGEMPPSALKDHALVGNWSGYRELHVEPDWLLIYRAEPGTLSFVRTGSHAALFR